MEVGALLQQALRSRYLIEHVLGRGGMAIVYRARDLKHDRLVAIKVLRPEIAATLGGERFLREIQIEARLQHPHILPLYDSGQADTLLYYVMPFVEGETLRQRLDREGQLPIEDAVALAEDVAGALSYAHSHGVVHRDVKPENILLTGGHALVADFGVARAVSLAGGKPLTSSGIAIGTPAYMSPEQGNGMEVDARSDVYSLGCVLYEMLAGEPPFGGPTAQAIIARHVSERPPSLRIVRPSIPAEIERTIERALAKVPADRFTTVSRFAESLETAAVATGVPSRRRVGRRAVMVALAVAAALAAVVVVPRVFVGSDLNPNHYIVGSVVPEGSGVDATLISAFEYELYGALRQIPEITLEGTTLVNEKRLEAGSRVLRLADWLSLARTFGAGRLVVLAAVPGSDTTELRVEVYDAREGEATAQRARIALPAGSRDVANEAARAVEKLFGLAEGVISIYASPNEAATRAFAAGRMALSHWDLGEARARFQDAVDLDPDYAKANFWLAQVASWDRTPAAEWLVYARRAMAGAERLSDDRERLLARALLALGQQDHPAACARYDSLVARDSLDFEAWFGLGECQARDPVVVRDGGSPSGWRFRTSYHGAMLAYERALDLVPSFLFAFRRAYSLLADTLLHTSPAHLRPGRRGRPDAELFAAYPGWHDTLGFVPYPIADVMEGKPEAVPATHRAAVDWSRRTLQRITDRWVRAFPDSFVTNLAHARALELRGDVDEGGSSAVAFAEKARGLAGDASDSLQVTILRARLFVRLERFGDAAGAARDALSSSREPTPVEAAALAGLAALVGQANLAAQLSAQAVPLLRDEVTERLRNVPTPIFDTRQRLVAFAGVGAPADSIRAMATRMDALVIVHPIDDDQFDCWARHTPIGFAFPVLRRVPAQPQPACWDNNGLLEMQWGLAQADTQRVRRVMDSLDSLRERYPPGDLAVEHAYHQAFLLLEVGDTIRAVEQMDDWLAALRAADQSVIGQPLKSGSLVRLFALRAQVAWRRGDLPTARRWAAPVAELWNGGDPEPRGLAARMDSIRTSGR